VVRARATSVGDRILAPETVSAAVATTVARGAAIRRVGCLTTGSAGPDRGAGDSDCHATSVPVRRSDAARCRAVAPTLVSGFPADLVEIAAALRLTCAVLQSVFVADPIDAVAVDSAGRSDAAALHSAFAAVQGCAAGPDFGAG